jgi:hypothetical protein
MHCSTAKRGGRGKEMLLGLLGIGLRHESNEEHGDLTMHQRPS